MDIRSLKEIKNLRGKRIFLRVDFNVPIKNKKVMDVFKIKKSLPTIKYLLQQGAKVIIASHLGRPEGVDKKLTLKPVAAALKKYLLKNIQYYPAVGGKILSRRESGSVSGGKNYWQEVEKGISKMNPGDVALLENTRFFSGEEKNDHKLAREFAHLADLYILDGFAVAHRSAASVSGIAKYLPAYAGFLLAEEITGLSQVMENPKKPLVVILGGAKAETKIPVLKNLLRRADRILIGGGIFNTYLWAKGYAVGGSLIDKNFKKEILRYCANRKVVLPVDVVAGDKQGRKAKVMPINSKFRLPNSNWGIYDIGPETVRLFAGYVKKGQTLLWNGAMGYFEQHPYEYGTYALARLFASRAKGKAFGICGGGETVGVCRELHLTKEIDLISTGGGAMLEFLGGEKLPGVEAVKTKKFFNLI